MVTKIYRCLFCQRAESVVRFGFTQGGRQRLRSLSVPEDVVARSEEPHLERAKRSPHCQGVGRADVPARHCTHFERGARHRARGAQKKAHQCRLRFADTLLAAIRGDALEMDELVVRFGSRRCYKYLWLAVSRLTHQVIGFWIGEAFFFEACGLFGLACLAAIARSSFTPIFTKPMPSSLPLGNIGPVLKAAARPASLKD
jgi:hypothetical protein